MKWLFFFFILLVSPFQVMYSQGKHKVKLYDSWYYLGPSNLNERPDLKVFTYEVADSSVIVIGMDRYLYGIDIKPEDYRVIPAKDIQTIKFRRKGSKTIGIVIGMTGVAAGIAIGLASGNSPAFTPMAVVLSTALVGGLCFGVALPLTSLKKTYRINGDVTRYRERRLEMIPHTIHYYTH
jgi:hypothetical protein